MLSLAQINSKNFRKDCSNLNIKETIEEVMLIQKHKADAYEINMEANYVNFQDSMLVFTD